MPKNRKEEILVLELWGREKATVGTNAREVSAASLGKAGHGRHETALAAREEGIMCGETLCLN